MGGAVDRLRTTPRAAAHVALLAATLCVACGGGVTSSGIRTERILARGVLAYDVAFDAAGTKLAAIELGTDFTLVVRDLAAGTVTRVPLGAAEWDVVDLALDRAGLTAATASLSGRVQVVRLAADPPVVTELVLDAPATAIAFSPDGRWLATGADSGILCLRRAADLAMVQCVAAHEGRLAAIAFTPNGEALATAGWDGRVVIWSSPSLAVEAERRAVGSANALAFSEDGHVLAIGRSAKPPARLSGGRERDGGAVVELWTWTAPEASDPRTLRGHAAAVVALAWTPDGRLVSGGWDRTVRVWQPSTGREVCRRAFDRVVRGVAASPDGRWIAVASFTGPDLEGRAVTLVECYR